MTTLCPVSKIDSNATGLRYAIEACLKVLPSLAEGDPADPIWYPLEPNSYGDFGAKITTVARNPINASRQRQKGIVTDLEANASFAMDMTQTNHLRLMQGFLFALAREKPTSYPINAVVIPTTAIAAADDSYAMDAPTAALFQAGDLIMASGFGVAANNGLKVVDTPVAGKVIVTSALTDEAAPPADAYVRSVGFQFPLADVDIAMVGGLPRLTSAAIDMTTLGLVAGEWVFLGDDTLANRWAVNTGFARIGEIDPDYLQFDKVSWAAPANESGAGKTIRLYFGTVVRNEEDPALIVRQSYQLERTLGEDADGLMSEYILGAVPNELSIDLKQAEKLTMDLSFVGADAVSRSGLEGVLAGARPSLVASNAFNSSNDVRRIMISVLDAATSTPTPLFVYCTDVSLKIKNSVTGAKAVGVLGNFEMIAGMLDVSGSLTAYYQDVRATQAVRDNEDITMDIILVKNNAGIAIDLPLIGLGNGLPKVEQDKSITVPLDTMAAQSSFGHTMLYVNFPYLPSVASP